MNQTEKIELKKARDFGAIINDTFAFLRQNVALLFKAILIITGPIIPIQGILLGLHSADTVSMNLNSEMGGAFAGIFTLRYLLIIMFGILSYTFITLIAYEVLVLYPEKNVGAITFDDLWKAIRRDFWMIVFTSVGSFFVLFFSIILLIIPGIYFAVVVTMVPIIRIQERNSFFEALRRSMRLMKGNWWFTFGLVFLLSIIMGAAGWIFGLPNFILTFTAVFHKADMTGSFYRVLFIIAGVIYQFSSFLSVIILVGIALQYYSLVEKKEGAGLLRKIEDIGRKNEG